LSSCAIASLLAVSVCCTPATLLAQHPQCVDARQLKWTPAVPRAGTLFEIRITGASAPITSASIAGVTLRSRPGNADTTRLLAAIPIDSVYGVTLRVTCTGGDSAAIRIQADSGRYRLEKLRVAPQFSAPPDSALAARLAEESARAAAVARASLDTPILWRQPFAAPRPSRITSPFGSGRTFNGEVVSRHMGTDFAGAVGSPVAASNRGVVRLIGQFYLGGNVVYVDHGAGLTTAYLHLSRTLVAEGDTVERGQTIGRVGATGRVTGPHLHFIARLGGITVDPASLLGRR
jgi:murein DD-endopeptidase MepM/ murein hydrolase activator NlpD